MEGEDEVKAVSLSIRVAGVADKVMSRAGELSPRTDRSRVARLDVVLAKGNEVKRVLAFDENTGKIDVDNFDMTGLVTGSFPVNPPDGINTDIKFRISPTDMEKVTDIYLVANYISEGTHQLSPLPQTIRTVAELNALKQGYPDGLTAGTLCTMFGHINMLTSQPTTSDDTKKEYSVALERTIAMITLAIDGTDLNRGVVITPISAKLVNVPSSCTINGAFPHVATVENVAKEGNSISTLTSRWGAVCSAATAEQLVDGRQVVPYAWTSSDENSKYTDAKGPHGTGEAVLPLFLFENKQGTGIAGSGAKPEVGKTPPAGKGELCSYIEVFASYRHSTQLGGNSTVGDKAGNIIYRFYLGRDVNSDFNVERNKHYMLTLQLSGYGGLSEDGYIRPDGSFNASGGGVSWRVDATFSNGGVVDNVLEVPAGGSRVDVILDGYSGVLNKNNVHITYGVKGGSNQVWIKTNVANGNAWSESPSENKLNLYTIDNGDGTHTLRVYVKPLGKADFESIGGALTTLEAWTERGYKEHVFHITGAKDANLNTTFRIRQWLPMPVMDPADVGTSTNPNDAKLYFSRFDIYHGKMLPWCHDGMVGENMWDILVTDAAKLNIWATWDAVETPQIYDRTNGFHKTVAYYRTNIDQGTINQIEFNDGEPQTMMAFSFFAAANAEAVTDMFVQSAADAEMLTHYGLPSIENWEKIEKYGKYDPRYPLMPGMQYWTSTISGNPAENGNAASGGTQTMVYTLGTGAAGATPKARGLKYPGRLVYRKDAKATRN